MLKLLIHRQNKDPIQSFLHKEVLILRLPNFIMELNKKRAQIVVSRIAPFLKKNQDVIDIGSGTGNVSLLVKKLVRSITPVDVADYRHVRIAKPVIYDGITLPFPEKSFNLALILMVMHHTSDPKRVLHEAMRVADELLVIETSYVNIFHKMYTVAVDALLNLQFQANWNSYKSDGEWRSLFNHEGLYVIESHTYMDPEQFLHILYYLKRKK